MRTICLLLVSAGFLGMVSCTSPVENHYYVVTPPKSKPEPATRPKPAPPVESAENFRAVEKPNTYSY